jgi:hypothetical protein
MKKQIQFPKHDLELEDLSDFDLQQIKSDGIRLIVDTPVSGQVEAIIKSYNSYLHSKGYKITKVKDNV